jgi:hypothetical protein
MKLRGEVLIFMSSMNFFRVGFVLEDDPVKLPSTDYMLHLAELPEDDPLFQQTINVTPSPEYSKFVEKHPEIEKRTLSLIEKKQKEHDKMMTTEEFSKWLSQLYTSGDAERKFRAKRMKSDLKVTV